MRAVLLTRLFSETRDAFKCFPDCRVTFWTDSEIVRFWLKKGPQSLKVFEGHRVAKIQGSSGNIKWHHVPGKENPADVLSRGQAPSYDERRVFAKRLAVQRARVVTNS